MCLAFCALQKNLPKAIKRVYVRILLFYICGTFIIGLLVSSQNPSLRLNSGTAKSPFVIAISSCGIKALPSIINACLLTSAWSAAYLVVARRRKQAFKAKFSPRGLLRGGTLGLCALNVFGGGLAYFFGKKEEKDE